MSLIKTNRNNCHHYKAIHRLFQMWDINILLMVKLSCTTCREAYPNICRMLAETVQCLFCTHKIHYLRNNFDSISWPFLHKKYCTSFSTNWTSLPQNLMSPIRKKDPIKHQNIDLPKTSKFAIVLAWTNLMVAVLPWHVCSHYCAEKNWPLYRTK